MKKTMKRPKAIQKPIVPILSNPKQKQQKSMLCIGYVPLDQRPARPTSR